MTMRLAACSLVKELGRPPQVSRDGSPGPQPDLMRGPESGQQPGGSQSPAPQALRGDNVSCCELLGLGPFVTQLLITDTV